MLSEIIFLLTLSSFQVSPIIHDQTFIQTVFKFSNNVLPL